MPGTLLLFEGLSTEEVTTEFLVALMDTADEEELPVNSISVQGENAN